MPKSTTQREKARAYKREARKYARIIGICQNCLTREAMPAGSFCGRCLELRNEYQKHRKDRYAAAGRCSKCGREREDPRRRMCAACRAQSVAYGRAKRARLEAA